MFGRKRFRTDNLFALTHWQPFLTSDNGGAAGGGSSVSNGADGTNGAAVSDGTTTPAAASTDWSAFAASLDKLGDGLASRLDALRNDIGQLPGALAPPPPAEPEPDFDSMTQGELAAHIVGKVMKSFEARINDILNPINAQINDVRQTVATRDVTADIAKMRADHKDFDDWKDDMVALAKQHSTLGIRQLYALARTENPAKAGELDKRYNPPAPPPPARWGGLTPNALNGNGATPKLSREQASAEAYREVAARHPGVLAALENM